MKRLLFWACSAGLAVGQQNNFVADTFAGTASIGDGKPAAQARFRETVQATRDAQGGYYLIDLGHHALRYLSPAGIVTTYAGTPPLFGMGASGLPATATGLSNPAGVAVGPDGSVYFSEYGNCVVRKVNAQGVQVVVVGQVNRCGAGPSTGPGTNVFLNRPVTLAMDGQGRLLIVDSFNNLVRRLDTAGNVTTVVGGGTSTAEGVAATAAQLQGLYGVAVGADGSIYVTEIGSRNRVRRVNPAGQIMTLAGTGVVGNTGDGGPAAAATFSGQPRGVAVNAAGTMVYIADREANRVRVVDLGTGIITHFAGQVDGTGGYTGDGGPAAAARLNHPEYLTVDPDGSVIIADRDNHVYRKVSPARTITTLAGGPRSIAETTAKEAEISDARDMAFDADGNAYILDRGSNVVRKVEASGRVTSITSPTLSDLKSIGYDSVSRALYLLAGGRLRRITGGQLDSFNFDLTVGGFAPVPLQMAVDGPRQLIYFVAPQVHQLIRLNLATTQIGSMNGTTQGFGGDGGPVANARFSQPSGIAVDSKGNLYVADFGNQRIRMIDTNGRVSTLLGPGAPATFTGIWEVTGTNDFPERVALDAMDRVVYTDRRVESILRFDPRDRTLRLLHAKLIPVGDGFFLRGVFRNADDGRDSLDAIASAMWVRADASGQIYFGTREGPVRYLRPYEITSFQIVSGDNQVAEVGKPLAKPLVVKATTTRPVTGISVSFFAEPDTLATLANDGALPYPLTAPDGTAVARAVLGNVAGPLRIKAQVLNAAEAVAEFKATALVAGASANKPQVRSQNGVIGAAAFGATATLAPGGWIEIYGSRFTSGASRTWSGSDFQGTRAPTSLDGVRVTIGGRDAFLSYVSPTQINAQVPDGLVGEVDLIVSTETAGPGDPVKVRVAATAPGLLAPPSFLIGGKQYIVALHSDGAFVGRPGLIEGAAFREAAAGDTLVLYGIGFGGTAPAVPAGTVVRGAANLEGVTITIGDRPATVTFAGLVRDLVGLYQFNVVMPAGVPAGDAAVKVQLRGVALEQNLVMTAK